MRLRAGNTGHCSKQPACTWTPQRLAGCESRCPPVPPAAFQRARRATKGALQARLPPPAAIADAVAWALPQPSDRLRRCSPGPDPRAGNLGQAGRLQVHLSALVTEGLGHLRHAALRVRGSRASWLDCRGMQHDTDPGNAAPAPLAQHETRHGLQKMYTLCCTALCSRGHHFFHVKRHLKPNEH